MGPVFLLAGGGRTGSTLIQRLILSTRQVLMWGEHGGILLPQLRQLVGSTHAWVENAKGNQMRANFEVRGHSTWVANMNPEITYFQDGCKAFLEQSLGAPARAMGYDRWGFKEIRYGRTEALILQELYPDASFVLLVRNPAQCLRSVKGAKWYARDFQSNPAQFLKIWAQISGELVDVQPQLKRSCLLRYEDVIADSQKATEIISDIIQIPLPAFDLRVFEQVLRGSPSIPLSLGKEDFEAMRDSAFLSVASRLKYEVPGHDVLEEF